MVHGNDSLLSFNCYAAMQRGITGGELSSARAQLMINLLRINNFVLEKYKVSFLGVKKR